MTGTPYLERLGSQLMHACSLHQIIKADVLSFSMKATYYNKVATFLETGEP